MGRLMLWGHRPPLVAGFAIYSVLLHKWRLFGNEKQEESFAVCAGLAWVHHFVVAGVEWLSPTDSEARFALLLFDSNAKLNVHAPAAHQPLRHRPLAVTASKDVVVVFAADLRLALFQTTTSGESNAPAPAPTRLRRLAAIDVSGLFDDARLLRSVLVLWQHLDTLAASTAPTSLVLHCEGTVALLPLECQAPSAEDSDAAESTSRYRLAAAGPASFLAQHVECVWAPHWAHHSQSSLGASLWFNCGPLDLKVGRGAITRCRTPSHAIARHRTPSHAITLGEGAGGRTPSFHSWVCRCGCRPPAPARAARA